MSQLSVALWVAGALFSVMGVLAIMLVMVLRRAECFVHGDTYDT